MKQESFIKEIQKRLPDDIVLEDETNFEFTDDEFVSILSWIKFFNTHYKEHGKIKIPDIVFPIVSKRLHLDFGLYITPCDIESNRGKHVIYISQNGKRMDGTVEKNLSLKDLINTWNL